MEAEFNRESDSDGCPVGQPVNQHHEEAESQEQEHSLGKEHEQELGKEQQEEFVVVLDGETFSLWNKFKAARGLSTDSEAASLLVKQFDKTQESFVQPLESANCAHCNTPLPLLCSNCKTQDKPPDPSPPDDSAEEQDPVIYRVLCISADGTEDNEAESRNRHQKQHHPGLDNSHLLLVKAKELSGSGKCIIIVDHFSKSTNDVHEMCSENEIFSAVKQSDSFIGEGGVRVSLNVSRQPQNVNYQNDVTGTTYYVQDSTGHQIDQVGSVVTMIPSADGEHWMEQLIYDDSAAQTVRFEPSVLQSPHKPNPRPGDSEAATAAAALEALSSDLPPGVPSIAFQTLKGKPRKTRNGKPIPTNRIRTCRMCGRHCFSPSDLQRHMLLHTGEKPFACDECGASFSQRGNWKKHKIEVHGSKNHLCPQCGVRFALVEDLHRHMRFHSGDRTHTCQICKSSYKTARNLRLHMRTHTRPFQCNECGVHFSTKRKLATHSQTHIGGKVFKCLECEATFSDHKSLTKHKDVHQGASDKRRRRPNVHMRYIIPSQSQAPAQPQGQPQSQALSQGPAQSLSEAQKPVHLEIQKPQGKMPQLRAALQVQSHTDVSSLPQLQSHPQIQLHSQPPPHSGVHPHSQVQPLSEVQVQPLGQPHPQIVQSHPQVQSHQVQSHPQVQLHPEAQYTVVPQTQAQYAVPSHSQSQYNVPPQSQYALSSIQQQYAVILPSHPQSQ